MGGIIGLDNKAKRPEYAKRKWQATKHITTTLMDILDHVRAPSTIDFLSLDIEGAVRTSYRTCMRPPVCAELCGLPPDTSRDPAS